MRSCPESAYILAFFALPPPLSDENPVMQHFFAYVEIIFAHILVFPACAIEVQHTNENSPTIDRSHHPITVAKLLLLSLFFFSVDNSQLTNLNSAVQ